MIIIFKTIGLLKFSKEIKVNVETACDSLIILQGSSPFKILLSRSLNLVLVTASSRFHTVFIIISVPAQKTVPIIP